MMYAEFKSTRAALELASKTTGRALSSFPKGSMGMTPDAVKATPEWKAAKRAFNIAFSEQREFSGKYVNTFKKEMAADRKAKREDKLISMAVWRTIP